VKVRLRFFAALREIIGRGEMEKDVAEGTTAGRIFEELVSEYPKLSSYTKVVQIAINQEIAERQRAVESEDEVAFLPPVSGG
jgi:molybdopterin converting factor subunit 1